MIPFRPALGIIRNVANLPANAQLLGQYGITRHITAQLAHCCQLYQKSQRLGGPPPIIEGVKCVEMIETCVSALHVLCKNADNRSYVLQANIVPVLIQV